MREDNEFSSESKNACKGIQMFREMNGRVYESGGAQNKHLRYSSFNDTFKVLLCVIV